MANESFKDLLNTYMNSYERDSYRKRNIHKEFPVPKVPRHDFF